MSSRNILVINSGSSSIKFALVNEDSEEFLIQGLAERLGSSDAVLNWELDGEKHTTLLDGADHLAAFARLLPLVQKASDGKLTGIGHRVVHGGAHFTEASSLSPEVIDVVRRAAVLAPLHNPAGLIGIEAAMDLYPELPHVAVFDTAFHQTMPPHAYRYAVPEHLYTDHHVRRYGFHGTSHLYVSKRAAALLGKPSSECNIITLHIGNGVSHCAIRGGVSVDTSMGLTPLEGAVMGSRCGDIDPAIPTFIMEREGYSAKEVDGILNKKSGLLGITGQYTDRRDIMEGMAAGDERCKLAYEIECYRIKKYIGAYMAVLGRVDAIVFTAGVGEMGSEVRQLALEGLEPLGIIVDKEKNLATRTKKAEVTVSTPESPVKVFVIPTDEELVFTEDVVAILQSTYADHMNFDYSFASADYERK